MAFKATSDRIDIYQTVTDAIVEALEAGTRPWSKPWTGSSSGAAVGLPLRHCGTPYRGINVLILWVRAEAQGYTSPFWFTYKQAEALGAQVRKGEKAARIVYYGTVTKEGEANDAAGDGEEITIRFAKTFNVFNADQIDGLPDSYRRQVEAIQPQAPTTNRIPELDAWAAATLADIRHGGDRAFYRQSEDFVQMPPFERFTDTQLYYSTLAHELTHWTKHPRRLDRDFGSKGFGSEGYATEELVAELASAFLGAEWGFKPDHIEDHAGYIGSWLQALKNDKRAIFRAAAHAQRAADYLLDIAQRTNQERAA